MKRSNFLIILQGLIVLLLIFLVGFIVFSLFNLKEKEVDLSKVKIDNLSIDTLVVDTVVVDHNPITVRTDSVKIKKDLPKEEIGDTSEIIVTLTVYNAVPSQCDNNPLVTADGTKIDLEKLKRGEIKYCAVSRDLLKIFPYGSIIYIEGFGEYIVHDTMNKRFKKYVDILRDVDEPLFKKKNVKVKKVK